MVMLRTAGEENSQATRLPLSHPRAGAVTIQAQLQIMLFVCIRCHNRRVEQKQKWRRSVALRASLPHIRPLAPCALPRSPNAGAGLGTST